MLPPTAVIAKKVGETPLAAVERFRIAQPASQDIPIAYAGRLDPMASGTLLLLLGDECKKQSAYHDLDKTYEFSVLFGVGSDTGDVLGRLEHRSPPQVTTTQLRTACRALRGPIALPYPHFSSKTVQGKPLHTWTLEGRLDEIEIPIRRSTVYDLRPLGDLQEYTGVELYERACARIAQLPTVTAPRKALGEDFRRADVLSDWAAFRDTHGTDRYTVAQFTCTASSGTYMRSLAEEIASACNTIGLAHHIHRTTIGHFRSLYGRFGYWTTQYRSATEAPDRHPDTRAR